MIRATAFLRMGVLMEQLRANVLADCADILATLKYFPKGLEAVTEPGEQAHVTRVTLKPKEVPLPPEIREAGKKTVKNLEAECEKLGLRETLVSVRMLSSFLADENSTTYAIREEAQQVSLRLSDGLSESLCYVIEPRDRGLVEGRRLFGDAVATQFPAAMIDIEEAGKCLAFDRSTACVFHLMRALEIGLQALAADLGIEKLDENWQKLLDQVDAKIRAMPFQTEEEKARRSKRSAVAAHLRNVKDAWRNDVMHPRETYTVEQARDVFNHTRALMGSLATFI